jgi:periplasmic protein TonB
MMIRYAGNIGLVSPLDFDQRKKPLPKWVWYAAAASVLVHTGVGFWLYNQRFSINPPVVEAERPATTVLLDRPVIKPEPKVSPTPPAASPPLNRPQTIFPSTVENLVAPIAPVTTIETGPAINISAPAPDLSTGHVVADTVKPVGPPVITEPNWVRKPTGDQLLRAYPTRAMERDITGSATLSCLVRVDGSLTGCSVANESPGGAGFGRSALSLSRYFQLSPRTVDGQAVDGARVNVTIRFNLD